MSELFNTWRRRFGLALLVMTMPLATCWVRSFGFCDGAEIFIGIRVDHFHSSRGTIQWSRSNRQTSDIRLLAHSQRGTDYNHPGNGSTIDFKWRWTWMGFDLGATTEYESWSPSYLEFWVIPYWSFVIPLTLLAAYLLLTKPQLVNPADSKPGTTKPGD